MHRDGRRQLACRSPVRQSCDPVFELLVHHPDERIHLEAVPAAIAGLVEADPTLDPAPQVNGVDPVTDGSGLAFAQPAHEGLLRGRIAQPRQPVQQHRYRVAVSPSGLHQPLRGPDLVAEPAQLAEQRLELPTGLARRRRQLDFRHRVRRFCSRGRSFLPSSGQWPTTSIPSAATLSRFTNAIKIGVAV
jgi:hypothetical protein